MGGFGHGFLYWLGDRARVGYGPLALAVCLFVAACSGESGVAPQQVTSDPAPESESESVPESASKSACYTVTHESGETELCDRPKKIAVLDTHSLDILLGLNQQPTGVVTPIPLNADRVEHPGIFIPSLGDRITTTPAYLGAFGQTPSLET
ncbi:MAG: hypothetical protein AAF889_12045, partial [Cyanobacteria bacterium P01_D01_bin.73]